MDPKQDNHLEKQSWIIEWGPASTSIAIEEKRLSPSRASNENIRMAYSANPPDDFFYNAIVLCHKCKCEVIFEHHKMFIDKSMGYYHYCTDCGVRIEITHSRVFGIKDRPNMLCFVALPGNPGTKVPPLPEFKTFILYEDGQDPVGDFATVEDIEGAGEAFPPTDSIKNDMSDAISIDIVEKCEECIKLCIPMDDYKDDREVYIECNYCPECGSKLK